MLSGRPEYLGSAVEAAVARLHRVPAVPKELGREWSDLLPAMTAMVAQDRPTAAVAARRLRTLAVGPAGWEAEGWEAGAA